MIVKSLLFIIICIYVYETISNFIKQKEEYFSNKEILNTDEYKGINYTIQQNCKHWSKNKDKLILQSYKAEPDESLDTPYSSRFKPLLFNKTRKYYWNPHYLIEEGQRRYLDDKKDLSKLQKEYNEETDINKKQILSNELSLYNWQNYIFKEKTDQGLQRDIPDITTDYYPEIIGQARPWIERHSHLPDYKRSQIDPIYKENIQKYDKKLILNECI